LSFFDEDELQSSADLLVSAELVAMAEPPVVLDGEAMGLTSTATVTRQQRQTREADKGRLGPSLIHARDRAISGQGPAMLI